MDARLRSFCRRASGWWPPGSTASPGPSRSQPSGGRAEGATEPSVPGPSARPSRRGAGRRRGRRADPLGRGGPPTATASDLAPRRPRRPPLGEQPLEPLGRGQRQPLEEPERDVGRQGRVRRLVRARPSAAGPAHWRVGKSPTAPTTAPATRRRRRRLVARRPTGRRAGSRDPIERRSRACAVVVLEDRPRSASGVSQSSIRWIASQVTLAANRSCRPRASRGRKSPRRLASSSRRLVRISRNARQPEIPRISGEHLVLAAPRPAAPRRRGTPRSSRAAAPPAAGSAPGRSAGGGRAGGRPS